MVEEEEEEGKTIPGFFFANLEQMSLNKCRKFLFFFRKKKSNSGERSRKKRDSLVERSLFLLHRESKRSLPPPPPPSPLVPWGKVSELRCLVTQQGDRGERDGDRGGKEGEEKECWFVSRNRYTHVSIAIPVDNQASI